MSVLNSKCPCAVGFFFFLLPRGFHVFIRDSRASLATQVGPKCQIPIDLCRAGIGVPVSWCPGNLCGTVQECRTSEEAHIWFPISGNQLQQGKHTSWRRREPGLVLFIPIHLAEKGSYLNPEAKLCAGLPGMCREKQVGVGTICSWLSWKQRALACSAQPAQLLAWSLWEEGDAGSKWKSCSRDEMRFVGSVRKPILFIWIMPYIYIYIFTVVVFLIQQTWHWKNNWKAIHIILDHEVKKALGNI